MDFQDGKEDYQPQGTGVTSLLWRGPSMVLLGVESWEGGQLLKLLGFNHMQAEEAGDRYSCGRCGSVAVCHRVK